jgi:hypothetical protein
MALKRKTVVNRHRCAAVSLCALVWSVTLASQPAVGATSHESVSTFIAMEKAGVAGSFDEVYQVAVGPSTGTVEVAQEAARGVRPFVTGPGRWSFVFQAQTGISSQWIEKGSTAWDCWHFSGVTTWTCSGPGQFQESNGFALSVEPYIPGLVLTQAQQLQDGLKMRPSPVKQISFFESNSARFGPLRCLKVDALGLSSPFSSCFDHRGILVTEHGDSFWSSTTLLRYRSVVPKSPFQLKGKSESSGHGFVTVPN